MKPRSCGDDFSAFDLVVIAFDARFPPLLVGKVASDSDVSNLLIIIMIGWCMYSPSFGGMSLARASVGFSCLGVARVVLAFAASVLVHVGNVPSEEQRPTPILPAVSVLSILTPPGCRPPVKTCKACKTCSIHLA